MYVLFSCAASGRTHSKRAPTASMPAPTILVLLLVMVFSILLFRFSHFSHAVHSLRLARVALQLEPWVVSWLIGQSPFCYRVRNLLPLPKVGLNLSAGGRITSQLKIEYNYS